MSAFDVFGEWFSQFASADWIALGLYLSGLFGYRYFLAFMLRNRPHSLFLGKLQEYRNAWIGAYSGGKEGIVVVQTLRNMIMSASFLASTAVILIMGALNLLPGLGATARVADFAGASNDSLTGFKVLLIIIILSYSFFKFTWYIREVNYMSVILNIAKDKLDEIEGGDSTPDIARMFLTSGIHFSLGVRGYYFLVPLLMWFFSPILMSIASVLIVYILIRRDLGPEVRLTGKQKG
ncbi:MAG: DUF599 domain-containing protein [Proteobacteria bacterium]|nr:DUF599 domain-containing protein [Pseudomonadota bacterium]MBU1709879.1 DUF599 domain-containing protein [Pseudomonadota bacterium]